MHANSPGLLRIINPGFVHFFRPKPQRLFKDFPELYFKISRTFLYTNLPTAKQNVCVESYILGTNTCTYRNARKRELENTCKPEVAAGFVPWRVRPHRVRPHIDSTSDQVLKIYRSLTVHDKTKSQKTCLFIVLSSIEGDWRTRNRKFRMSSWGRTR